MLGSSLACHGGLRMDFFVTVTSVYLFFPESVFNDQSEPDSGVVITLPRGTGEGGVRRLVNQ
jgi:hypothetical protein